MRDHRLYPLVPKLGHVCRGNTDVEHVVIGFRGGRRQRETKLGAAILRERHFRGHPLCGRRFKPSSNTGSAVGQAFQPDILLMASGLHGLASVRLESLTYFARGRGPADCRHVDLSLLAARQ